MSQRLDPRPDGRRCSWARLSRRAGGVRADRRACWSATLLTPISLPSIIGQLFNGIDSEALLAVPFFLLVGELMTSANVVGRMIDLSQAMVGHIRGGLAQVVTAVQHVLLRHLRLVLGRCRRAVAHHGPSMAREGYDPASPRR